MHFSFEQFYLTNRRFLIWIVVAALLWLLSDYFGLIFVVIALVTLVVPIQNLMKRRLHVPERGALIAIYVVMIIATAVFVRFVTPAVIGEGSRLVRNLDEIQDRLIATNQKFAERYPSLQRPLLGYLRNSLEPDVRDQFEADLTAEARRLNLPDDAAHSPSRWLADNEDDPNSQELLKFEEQRLLSSLFSEAADRIRALAPHAFTLFYQGIVTLALALLFSFLILIDKHGIRAAVNGLQRSRLSDFYNEAAEPLSQLGASISTGIRSQVVIAAINATLTGTGLALLGVPSVAMLSIVVFICGFVPVIGVFASTLPILIIALNKGGEHLILAAMLLILIVHFIESYLLNPLIYGAGFQFNPVLTLIILFIAYHAFGVWGMLLGLPVARYLIRDVFAIPID